MTTMLAAAPPRSTVRCTAGALSSWQVLGALWAVTRAEMRLQWRSPAFWVVLASILAITPLLSLAHSVEFGVYNYLGGAPSFLNVEALNWTGVAAVYAALAPLLALFSFNRDRRLRTLDLLWTRPLSPAVYVAGKVLALGLLLIPVSAAGVALSWAMTSWRVGMAVPLYLFVVEWIALIVPTILLGVAVCLVLALLLPHPVLGLAAWWGAVWYLSFYQLCTMLRWQNVFLTTLWYRPGAGFGPDTPLLLGNRLLWLAIVVGVLGLAPLLYRRRYPMAIWSQRASLWPAGLLGASLVLGGGGVAVLRAGTDRVMEPATPAVAATQLASVTVSGYEAALRLDPAAGTLRGTVAFTLASAPGQRAAAAVPLALAANTGLVVDRVTADGHDLALGRFPGLTRLSVPGPLPRMLRVTYHGFLRIARSTYGAVYHEAGESYGSVDLAAYVGSDVTYLTAGGDWYPVPQVAGVTRWAPPRVGWRRLAITLPGDGVAASSATARSREGGQQTLVWTGLPDGRLPGALVAWCAACAVQEAPAGQLVASAALSHPDARHALLPFAAAYRAVEEVMGTPGRPTIVALPTIAGPISGGSLVFVPEEFWLSLAGQGSPGVSTAHLTGVQQERVALSAMATAWWAGHVWWQGSPPAVTLADVQAPYGYLSTAGSGAYSVSGANPALAMATGVLAARRLLGDHYFRDELALRQWRWRSPLFSRDWAGLANGVAVETAARAPQWRLEQSMGLLPLIAAYSAVEGGDLANAAGLSAVISHVGGPRTELFLRASAHNPALALRKDPWGVGVRAALQAATAPLLGADAARFWQPYPAPVAPR